MNDHDLGGLGADARGLIAAARDLHEPSARQRARVHWKLELSLASGAAVAGYSISAAASAVKVILVVAALGMTGGGVWLAMQRARAPLPLAPALPAVVTTPQSALAATAAMALPKPEENSKNHAIVPARAPVARAGASATGRLAAEAAQLQRVNGALRQGEGGRALALLADYDQRFQHGALFAERSAARVLALCALGNQAAAVREQRQFLSRWPRSPLADRMRASCAGTGPAQDAPR